MRRISIGARWISWSERGVGEPVVAIHSSGMSAGQWRKLAADLDGRYRVALPDLIGYGESSPVAPGEEVHYALDQLALERLVDELDAPVHLVGHSYGGFLALLVALHRPARVRSVAVYEPVSFGVLRSTGDREALATLPHDTEARWPEPAEALERWLEGFIDYWNGTGGWRALPEPVRETFRRTAPKVIGEVRTLRDDHTPHEAYASLAMPVLLLGGERSTLAAARVLDALEGAIPKAARAQIAGAGHMGPITHAPEVAARIAAHLASS